jgi:TRAP transporter 4TM/12TM fusion protein
MRIGVKKLITGYIWCVFAYHLFYVVGLFEIGNLHLNAIQVRAISLVSIAIVVLITSPVFKNRAIDSSYRVLLILVVLVTCGYITVRSGDILHRLGSPTGFEVALGILAIILVLELTRITTGKGLVILTGFLLVYTLLASHVPGVFLAPSTSVKVLSGQTYLGLMGIFGVPLGVTVDYVFAFLVFGFAIQATGGVDFFTRLGKLIFGRMRGSSAKVAILLNYTFSMVSGTAVGNVLVTGPLTIPQMRKEGYSEAYTGGLISVAGTASQITPPIMGITAFVMADYLSMPYILLCYAALIPAALYYLSLVLFVDLEARRKNIQRPSPAAGEAIPLKKLIINNWHILFSFIVLVVMLVGRVFSVRLIVILSSVLLIAAASFRKESRINLEKLRWIVKNTVNGMTLITPPTATAGIIIALLGLTAMDYRFSTLLSELAGGNLVLAMVFVTIACIVLGMGLPTLPAYIVVVLLVAPAFMEFGITPIVAHMFVFYMALAAMITPPVCLNVFAVMPLVKATMWPIGLTALRIGMATFIIPVLFVYNPGLLLVGSPATILWAIFSGTLVIAVLCFALSQHGFTHANWIETVASLAGAFLLYFPISGLSFSPKAIAVMILAIALLSQIIRWRKYRRYT